MRPDFEGPTGLKTDEAEAAIDADYTIVNEGTVEDLLRQVDDLFTVTASCQLAA